MTVLEKYAHLLVTYCLELKKGELLYIQTTTLAEPLLREVYKAATRIGVNVEYNLTFREQTKLFLANADDDLLQHVSPITKQIMETADAYLVIRAPFNLYEDRENDPSKANTRQKAMKEINEIYFDRTADRRMKRCLCQYPTQASAQEAKMSLEAYEKFVFNACYLYTENPHEEWLKVRADQQKYVDYLNNSDLITYRNSLSEISFSIKGRTWINSDGQNNMPSGEVFTAPIEDSVNGTIYFNYPSIYMGNEVEGVTLTVKNGEVVSWKADKGQTFLDKLFEIEGSRLFGEVAIGTNYNIQRSTKNILFDEKIGGTIHMALGQSYKQTGGLNQSAIHWDLITDMRNNAEIIADGIVIYQNGKFLI